MGRQLFMLVVFCVINRCEFESTKHFPLAVIYRCRGQLYGHMVCVVVIESWLNPSNA